MSLEPNLTQDPSLSERLEASPADWDTRRQLACLLYDQEALHKAATLILEAAEIPSTDLDLAGAARILAKNQPRKAIRLLTAICENNRGNAEQNMAMANALLNQGMVLESARFYGAALEINPKLVNPELEHFFLWTDDEQSLWGGLKDRRPQLAELPWMMRDSKEALKLTSRVSQHTTPIALPKFTMVDGVAVLAQSTTLGANPTGVRDDKQIAACDDLRDKLDGNSGDWDIRQQLAHMLYDQGAFDEAATVIWEANPIPSIDLDLAFAARILSKDQPRKAIRLLTAVLEQNRGKAVQNMGLANALLHYGMVLQAARFYGAALENDPNLVNPDLQHFILWTDDAQFLWGNFMERRPPLGNLPWPSIDPMESLGIQFQSPPIAPSALGPVKGEELHNDLYQQFAKKNAKITPPPAVTIPADRVAPKDRRFDSTYGASTGEDTKPKVNGQATSKALPVTVVTPPGARPGVVTPPGARPGVVAPPGAR
ncbi:MAG: tetratricopeptide repeat protein, partial [Verrucomicrobiota bacterium]